MKQNKNIIFKYVLASFTLLSQWSFSQPNIEWQKSYWAPTYPTSTHQPDPPTAPNNFTPPIQQSQSGTGEDWFYAHAISKGANNQPNGYICGGYSSFINYIEYDASGCMIPGNLVPYDCDELERAYYQKGYVKSVLSLVDLNGNSLWYKTYSSGTIFNVIQTSDGGYLAVSSGISTEDGLGNLIAYNPNQTPGHVTDYFVHGNADINGSDKSHIRLIKVDADGEVQWEYMYGLIQYTGNGVSAYDAESGGQGRSAGAGLIETSEGNFMFTGWAKDPTDPIARKACVIVVDHQGMWKWGKFYGPTSFESVGSAITKTGTGPGQMYFIAGVEDYSATQQRAFLFKIDNSVAPIPTWTTYHYGTVSTREGAKAGSTLAINSAGEVLVPVLVNIKSKWTGLQGEAYVFRVNPSTGADISFTNFGNVAAYDLTVGVTATADGGFAIATSKQLVVPPYFPAHSTVGTPVCYYNADIHIGSGASDGYVAKCDADGNKEWDKIFDGNTNRPPGDPTTWPYPDIQMRDIRRQECLYSIVQSPDGGFVVAGNNSENFDDSYLVKLESVCTNYNLSGLVLNTNSASYLYEASDYIIASTVEVTSGNGSVDFRAGNIISLLPGFTAQQASTFRANIDPSIDCTPNGRVQGNANEVHASNINTVYEMDVVGKMGTVETNSSILNIFPNPSNGLFTVQTDDNAIKSIYVYNLLGDLVVIKESFIESQFNIDITELPKGLYFVKVIDNGILKTGKIIHH